MDGWSCPSETGRYDKLSQHHCDHGLCLCEHLWPYCTVSDGLQTHWFQQPLSSMEGLSEVILCIRVLQRNRTSEVYICTVVVKFPKLYLSSLGTPVLSPHQVPLSVAFPEQGTLWRGLFSQGIFPAQVAPAHGQVDSFTLKLTGKHINIYTHTI